MPQQVPQGPNGYPIVQGIELVPISRLPDRIRAVFKHNYLNAVQSKSFSSIYESNDNFVLSAPTGSGKTTILELAICRLIATSQPHQFKVIYQAPTKALCSERRQDWSARFRQLDVSVVELTGDTEVYQLKAVSHADIIVTTPEKWDSMTRKWKDHKKFMELVKLFLIDEVHILKEERGASLETVVSRMKSVGSGVRFVALSATVPNSDDIATWLGRNSEEPSQPARREVFGEDFRPVKLIKHVVGMQGSYNNDFALDKACTDKLPDIIVRYGQERKPIMIFCFTKKSCEETATMLSNWWSSSDARHQMWRGPTKQTQFKDPALRQLASAGVAFHHSGIDLNDRVAIEKAYLGGNINVICCTSTLAVGVNLPCHLVIIKNTLVYDQTGCKEYSDLEIMQMLGRAGRPQFDKSAIAVIMTKNDKVRHYESMMSGQEVLESRLHLNLIEHLNAEIGLGTVTDGKSAKQWMEGTFFFVRLSRNFAHYKATGQLPGRDVHEVVEQLCAKHLESLHEFYLIAGAGAQNIKSTEYGDAMARYYVMFDTMRCIMGLARKPKMSEILSALSQAAEFKQIRLRSNEKLMLRDINSSPAIKFPIEVDLAAPAHKVSLLLQATLGGIDLRSDDRFKGIASQIQSEMSSIYSHIIRLIRCVIDCQLQFEDSVGARNALELSRSLGAKSWDDSPLQLQQIPKLGPVSVRKLVNASIRSIEELEATEAHKIDHILSKNPPFGMKLLSDLEDFPKLRVALKTIGEPRTVMTDKGKRVRIRVKADVGFLNDTVPIQFNKKPVYVCLLAETSDGHLAHFARMSAAKISNGIEVQFQADLCEPQQLINCWVSCDDFAGTQKMATLKSAIAAGLFPPKVQHEVDRPVPRRPALDEKKRKLQTAATQANDDFGIDELDDADIVAATEPQAEYQDIDDVVDSQDDRGASLAGNGNTQKTANRSEKRSGVSKHKATEASVQQEPKRLPNGNWECFHHCTDKQGCKHPCCKVGLENKPKPRKPKKSRIDDSAVSSTAKPTSKATKIAKKPAHTDPFTASRRSVNQCLTVQPSTADRPVTRDTEFGDENDFWDDPAIEEAIMEDSHRFENDKPFARKAPHHDIPGLFVTSSIRPYDEVDLSSGTPDEARYGKRPLSNTSAQLVKKARLSENISYHGRYEDDPDQEDGQCISMRDLENSCNVTTFSKRADTKRASVALDECDELDDFDADLGANLNDAPYGWAPINSTDNSPSKPVHDGHDIKYPADDDDNIGIIESALYPTTFTAVNQPRRARPFMIYDDRHHDVETAADTLPSLSDLLRPDEQEHANEDEDQLGGDETAADKDEYEFQDEGYGTIQHVDVPAEDIAKSRSAKQDEHTIDDLNTPARGMKEEKDEEKDEIPAWMWEKFGDVAEFI